MSYEEGTGTGTGTGRVVVGRGDYTSSQRRFINAFILLRFYIFLYYYYDYFYFCFNLINLNYFYEYFFFFNVIFNVIMVMMTFLSVGEWQQQQQPWQTTGFLVEIRKRIRFNVHDIEKQNLNYSLEKLSRFEFEKNNDNNRTKRNNINTDITDDNTT